jgi:hypothetical protein
VENGSYPNGANRLDRIERAIEALIDAQQRHEQQLSEQYRQNNEEHRQFRQDYKMLLAAQVALTEQQKITDMKMAETTEKLNALIAVVDDLLRRKN